MFSSPESAIFALFIAGIIFTSIELFVPGFGIFGAFGLLSTVISLVLTLIYIPYGIIIVTVEIIILVILCYLLFKYLKKKHLYGKLILNDTLETDEKIEENGNLKEYVGKEGISRTVLKPFGFAEFDGVSLEVNADGNYIAANKKIKAIGIANNKIVVKEL